MFSLWRSHLFFPRGRSGSGGVHQVLMFVTLLTTPPTAPLSSVSKSRLDRPTVVADVPRGSLP